MKDGFSRLFSKRAIGSSKLKISKEEANDDVSEQVTEQSAEPFLPETGPVINIKNNENDQMETHIPDDSKTLAAAYEAVKEIAASITDSIIESPEDSNQVDGTILNDLFEDSKSDSSTSTPVDQVLTRENQGKNEKDDKIAVLENVIAEMGTELKELREMFHKNQDSSTRQEPAPMEEKISVDDPPNVEDIPELEVSNAEEVEEPAVNLSVEEFAKLSKQIFQLNEEITSRFRQDDSKDRIIDNLHRELQGFKENQKKDAVKDMVFDLILTIDRTKKLADEFDTAGEQYPKKLVNVIKETVVDLEDILYRRGINSYNCDDDVVDPKRQTITRTIKVDDPSIDKKIAEVVGNGYIWDEKIIRPERVKVYMYKQPKSN